MILRSLYARKAQASFFAGICGKCCEMMGKFLEAGYGGDDVQRYLDQLISARIDNDRRMELCRIWMKNITNLAVS